MRCTNPCPLYSDSDRKSRLRQRGMSTLPPKADMCSVTARVRYEPKADIGPTSDEHSDAWQNNPDLSELARLSIHFD